VSNSRFHEHLGAEALQAFLDGALSPAERARAEEHLSSCARCAAEVDGWRQLFEGIEDLPVLAPRAGFADRVVAGIETPEPLTWAARVRTALGTHLVPDGHVDDERLQDLAAGALAARQETRLRAHLDACPECASRAQSWSTVLAHLDGLGRFAPSEAFAARVMAEVRVPVPAAAPVPAPAPARVPEWRRMVARVRALVPRSRRAWATISGVAVTPVVTLGLVLWTVLTHPAITAAGLASFAWWKAQELGSLVWGAATARALQSTQLFGLFSWIRSLALSPTALVALFLAFSAGTLAAAWVLYRNLVKTHPVDAGYGHASLS
jgi:anti-sigma factor RsiW